MAKKGKFVIPLAIAIAAGIIACAIFKFGLFNGLELFFEDRLFSPSPVDEQLVIVAIDDESIQKIGQWPWPREVYARFLNTLDKSQPKAVAIDVLFSEKSRLGNTDDALLSYAIKNADFSVILAAQGQNFNKINGQNVADSFLSPLDIFDADKAVVNVIANDDGVVRYVPITIIDSKSDTVLNTLALETLKKAGIDVPKNLEGIERIFYSAQPGTIRTIPFYQLLDAKTTPDLSGKIVLVGATAPSLHDTAQTPLSDGREMAGIEIHANIANMVLQQHYLHQISSNLNYALVFIVAFISGAICLFVVRLEAAILINVVLGLLYIFIIVLFFERGTIVPMVHITLSWIFATASVSLYRFFSSEKERRMVRSTFSKYVSPSVLKELLDNPEKITLGGEEKEVTILFSDIRGFTSISEQLPPKELVRVLNKYFSAVTNKIIENDGVLDKYIGDAIMAFWGAPLSDPEQGDKAVKAAKEMLEELQKLNVVLKEAGDPEIHIGIGICTGKAIVGNVGSEHRFDYTVIGDAVNAASRIEGLTKEFKSPIIISESTKNKLSKKIELKSLGETSVKGKVEKITIYAIH